MRRITFIGFLGGVIFTAAFALSAEADRNDCIVGTGPDADGDIQAITTLREQIGLECDCADYDGSTRDTSHRLYVRCARILARAAARAGDLRRPCRRTVIDLYDASVCGYPEQSDPATSEQPCIEQSESSGIIRCSVKSLDRCESVPGIVSRTPCPGAVSCLDAADDNGNFIFNNDPTGGDDEVCNVGNPNPDPNPDPNPNPGVVRFVAVGDTGQANTGQLAVASAIAAKCAASGCDFVQLLGDNIYESGVTSTTDPQWKTKFETPYKSVNAPFYVVLGNHDYGGNGVGDEFDKGQHEIDYTAVSTKWKLPAAYYHRTVSNVEFFALDTNAQIYKMDAQQRTKVASWLAASTATWQIAFGHHPYRSNGPHGNAGSFSGAGGNGAGVKSFMEGVVCGNADVYFSGHDHTLQWLTPTCSGTELVVSGTGASATTLPGSNATRFESLALGFVYVVIDGKTLTASMIDKSGKTLFTRTLTKP